MSRVPSLVVLVACVDRRELYSHIAGSVLLAINEEIVINKTQESIRLLLHSLSPPTIFLIACPYQQSPITPFEVNEYLANNGLTTTNLPSLQEDVPPRSFISASSLSEQEPVHLRLFGSFNHQQDYTNRPYAVDFFMFPQSQGYTILEQQWLRWV